MPRKRYKPDEIVAKLRQVDMLVLYGRRAPRRVLTAIMGGTGSDQSASSHFNRTCLYRDSAEWTE